MIFFLVFGRDGMVQLRGMLWFKQLNISNETGAVPIVPLTRTMECFNDTHGTLQIDFTNLELMINVDPISARTAEFIKNIENKLRLS